MTTKPKAKKFRIRRSGTLTRAPGVAAAAPANKPEPAGTLVLRPTRPAPGGQPLRLERPARPGPASGEEVAARRPDTARPAAAAAPHAPQGEISSPGEVSAESDIDAIRREGLTGRQLRLARRNAQRHGLAPTSDFDAIRLMRKRGLDPFERPKALDLISRLETAPNNEPGQKPIQLPQTVPAGNANLPAKALAPIEERAAEIRRIQRDIAQRRRRKLALLATRLAFFVLLPTLIAGYYFFAVATPLYATKSEFVIQQAESQSAVPGLGGLFAGTQFATNQDSIAVQSYLQSRDAMIRLDGDLGFKAHFSEPEMDAIQRLPPGASNEEAYKVYKRHVKIAYDPTEGIIKMTVRAASPETSAAFSEALISYAEEQVDNLTQRLREDQMSGARESFAEAEQRRSEALARLLTIQQDLEVLDPVSEAGSLMGQITSLETQMQERQLQLAALLDNRSPNAARVEGVRADIRRLEAAITELRGQMTDPTGDGSSLAVKNAELRVAEADFATRDLMLQQALQQMETARIEANRQVRYLSMGVNPLPPDEPTYPRAFEKTFLAFLVFGGVYLMISLTASILREQVSS